MGRVALRQPAPSALEQVSQDRNNRADGAKSKRGEPGPTLLGDDGDGRQRDTHFEQRRANGQPVVAALMDFAELDLLFARVFQLLGVGLGLVSALAFALGLL